jgi:hypothetical protein
MSHSQAIATESACLTARQIADLLAVQMWAHVLVADRLERFAQQRALLGPRTVAQLESLLVSVRSVADARGELARLDGELLLDGFEVWAARQRAVMNRLVSSSLGGNDGRYRPSLSSRLMSSTWVTWTRSRVGPYR